MPSPLPVVKDQTLDFGDALQDVARGLRISRKEWPKGMEVFLQGNILHIAIPENDDELNIKKGTHKFLVSEGDILASDWVVVPRG